MATIRFSERFVVETTNPNGRTSIYSDLFGALRNMTTDQSFLLPKGFNPKSAQTNISIAGSTLNKKFSRRYVNVEGENRFRIFRVK